MISWPAWRFWPEARSRRRAHGWMSSGATSAARAMRSCARACAPSSPGCCARSEICQGRSPSCVAPPTRRRAWAWSGWRCSARRGRCRPWIAPHSWSRSATSRARRSPPGPPPRPRRRARRAGRCCRRAPGSPSRATTGSRRTSGGRRRGTRSRSRPARFPRSIWPRCSCARPRARDGRAWLSCARRWCWRVARGSIGRRG